MNLAHLSPTAVVKHLYTVTLLPPHPISSYAAISFMYEPIAYLFQIKIIKKHICYYSELYAQRERLYLAGSNSSC